MTVPKIGQAAPDFELPNQDGELVQLDDFGRPLVLYFYPKDDTPGCTKEACNFRDDYSRYEEAGITILGVSPDSAESHQRFIEKYDLPFPLIADKDAELAKAYGVWGVKKIFGREITGVKRTTFVIDEEDRIARIFHNVRPAEHSQEILEALRD